MQPFMIFGLGFALGLEHALDADHVVAVSTFVSQTRSLRKSSMLGVAWGLGHTTTLLAVGLLLLVFKLTIPARLALTFEFMVGVLLVVLGINVIRKGLRDDLHLHRHGHDDGTTHVHIHDHSRTRSHNHTHTSFAVGMVHGLAGSAALLLLALSSVASVLQGLLFIVIFGVGSVLGMFLTTTAMAVPLQFLGRYARANLAIKLIAGIASIAVGMVLMYQIGVVNSLFVNV